MAKFLLIGVLATLCVVRLVDCSLIKLSEDNWTDVLEGEWFVEFYAPWCPACKNFQMTWELLAESSEMSGVKIAQVDVTEHPGMNGRFMLTSLPTIYHVKDGVFRHYTGGRRADDFHSFVEEKKWQKIEPVAWYMEPTSIQMAIVANFFRFSFAVRDFHETITSKFGLPTWSSYLIIAAVTILIGCFIGLGCVLCCDFFLGRSSQQDVDDAEEKEEEVDEDESEEELNGAEEAEEEEPKEEEAVQEEEKAEEKEAGEGGGDAPPTPGTPGRSARRRVAKQQ